MTRSNFPHFPHLFLTSLAFEPAASSCLHPEKRPGELPQMSKPTSEAPRPGEAFGRQLPMPLPGAGKGEGQPSLGCFHNEP